MLTIYEDKRFEEKTYSELEEAAAAMQSLVNAFNALGLGDVEQNELGTLANNPTRLYDVRLEKIEIPAGFRRDKYLEIMELPDLTDVLRLGRDYRRFERYGAGFFNFKGGKISVNAAKAKQMAEMHTVSVEVYSPAYPIVKRLMDAVEGINEANELAGLGLIRPVTVKVEGLCMELDMKSHTNYSVKINPFRIRELIRNIERRHVPTVNNS